MPLPPGLGFKTFKLRSGVFRLIVNVAMYSRRGLENLPSFIENARDRKPMPLEGVVSSIVQSYQSNPEGIMTAVECRDRASWQTAVPSDAGDPPVSAFVPGLCIGWSPLGPPPLIAHDTKIPTLLLAGKIDPITPPCFAHLAATALGARVTVVEAANVGHAVQLSSDIRNPAIGVTENPATSATVIPQRMPVWVSP